MIEICVFNIASAVAAEAAGADRLELCENYANGGTTPSYGYLKVCREKINIPVFPMIRPRAGDFCYSDEEFDIIQKDILLCKELGFEGVVIGLLNIDGSIALERTKKLVTLAYPLEVTFHRAFDRCKDPLNALETIIQCGCQRILTSGQQPTAAEGKELIKELIEIANSKIIIMPGSGLKSSNIADIKCYTGACEFHASARKRIPTTSLFINRKISEDLNSDFVDTTEIKQLKAQANIAF